VRLSTSVPITSLPGAPNKTTPAQANGVTRGTSPTGGIARVHCRRGIRSDADTLRGRDFPKVITSAASLSGPMRARDLAAVPDAWASEPQAGFRIVHSSYGTDVVTGVALSDAHGSPGVLLSTCHASESTPGRPPCRDGPTGSPPGPSTRAVTTMGGAGTLGVASGSPPGAGRAGNGKFRLSRKGIQQG
jgi:hypothetical protein